MGPCKPLIRFTGFTSSQVKLLTSLGNVLTFWTRLTMLPPIPAMRTVLESTPEFSMTFRRVQTWLIKEMMVDFFRVAVSLSALLFGWAFA